MLALPTLISGSIGMVTMVVVIPTDGRPPVAHISDAIAAIRAKLTFLLERPSSHSTANVRSNPLQN